MCHYIGKWYHLQHLDDVHSAPNHDAPRPGTRHSSHPVLLLTSFKRTLPLHNQSTVLIEPIDGAFEKRTDRVAAVAAVADNPLVGWHHAPVILVVGP